MRRRRLAAPAPARTAPWRRAGAEQVVDHAVAHLLEAGVVVERLAVARAREVDRHRGPERRPGPGGQRHDAVGEQERLVDVVGDQHHRLLVALPDALDLVLQRGAGERVEAPSGSSSSSTSGSIASARATETRCRMPPESSAGRLSRAGREVDQREVAARRARAASSGGQLREDLVDARGRRSRRRSARAAASSSGRRRRGRARPRDRPAVEQDGARVRRGQARRSARSASSCPRPSSRRSATNSPLLDLEVDVAQHLRRARAPDAVALADVVAARGSAMRSRRRGSRRSTGAHRRSSTKPTRPMVRMHRMMCS